MTQTPAPITVGQAPTLLCKSGSFADPVTVVVSSATETTWLGGADVASSSGFPLAVGDVFTLDLRTGDDLYAVTASGTGTVRILRTAS